MTRFDAELLSHAPRLRYILQFGVGLEARVGKGPARSP
jgi:phosphoglycerate dehydrogenase-like enzyme